MRISWFSNSAHAPSGYGNQTKLFVPRLHNTLGHRMAITAFYGNEGAIIDWNGIPIYPKGQGAGPAGIDVNVLSQHARHFRADLVISLMDVWVLPPGVGQGVPFAPWFPVDHEPLPPPIARSLNGVLMPLVFSHFAERMLTEAGLPYRYVPHGVETAVFSPRPRAEVRAELNLPADAFIVGIVAANKGAPCRKAIKQQIAAFKRLRSRHSDALLYLHTMLNAGDGENLAEYIEQQGFPDDSVMWTNQYEYTLGLAEPQLRDLYCAFDVLSNVSMGEGFGITILEAQACGVPVLVGDWTSMSELCFSGWTVPKEGAERWHTPLGSYQWWPSVDAIAEQMEAAYQATDRDARGSRAVERALEYDADIVTDTYWRPVLDELGQMIADRKPKSFQEYLTAVPAAQEAAHVG